MLFESAYGENLFENHFHAQTFKKKKKNKNKKKKEKTLKPTEDSLGEYSLQIFCGDVKVKMVDGKLFKHNDQPVIEHLEQQKHQKAEKLKGIKSIKSFNVFHQTPNKQESPKLQKSSFSYTPIRREARYSLGSMISFVFSPDAKFASTPMKKTPGKPRNKDHGECIKPTTNKEKYRQHLSTVLKEYSPPKVSKQTSGKMTENEEKNERSQKSGVSRAVDWSLTEVFDENGDNGRKKCKYEKRYG